jgi:integrase
MLPSRPLKELADNALQYLRHQGYAEATIISFRSTWNILCTFAAEQGISHFSMGLGLSCLEDHYGVRHEKDLTKHHKNLFRRIAILQEINASGEIQSRSIRHKKRNPLHYLQPALDVYLDDRRRMGLKAITVKHHEYQLRQFFLYLENSGLKGLLALTPVQIYGFLESITHFTVLAKEGTLYTLRSALRFYCAEGMCSEALSKLFPTISVHSYKPPPSCFSPAELSSVLSEVDRSTKNGKRDYLVLLLAMLLGMRAGDIRFLEFENIKWSEEVIEYTQKKTGKLARLPMPRGLQLAFLDYLKNSRPSVDSPLVFVKMSAPYSDFAPNNSLYYVLGKYLKRTGIELRGRKHGLHSLRSSFASNMLRNGTPMSTISGILGHQYQDTTNTAYLKVDLLQLRQAALEVSV